VKFDKIIVGFKLFCIALKASMMSETKRELYLSLLRSNIDLNPEMSSHDRKVLHHWIDQIEKSCDK
jgi:hypothetical protein